MLKYKTNRPSIWYCVWRINRLS